jgi:hypothetical protein
MHKTLNPVQPNTLTPLGLFFTRARSPQIPLLHPAYNPYASSRHNSRTISSIPILSHPCFGYNAAFARPRSPRLRSRITHIGFCVLSFEF